MKSALILLVIAIAILAAGRGVEVVHACSCAGTTPYEAFQKSDVVFSGTIVRVDRPSWLEELIFDSADATTFEVSEVWKGPNQATITLKTGGGSTCAYTFREGRYYLVYVSEREGQLQTSLCSGTKSLSSAREDIAELNSLSAPMRPEQQPHSTVPNLHTVLLLASVLLLSGSLLVYLRRTGRITMASRYLSEHPRAMVVLPLLIILSVSPVVVNILMPQVAAGILNALPLACPMHRPVPVLTGHDATQVMKAAYSPSQQRWDIERPILYAYCNRPTEPWWQCDWDSCGQIGTEGVPDEVEEYALESKVYLPMYRVFACSNDTGQVLREEGWVDGMTGKLIVKIPVEVSSGISSCDHYWY